MPGKPQLFCCLRLIAAVLPERSFNNRTFNMLHHFIERSSLGTRGKFGREHIDWGTLG